MIAKNAKLLFQTEPASIPALDVVVPAVPDARLQPHESVRDGTRVFKTDALTHGDDHFFPGPTDIAWDLAGAIVEWRMDEGTRDRFLARYRSASGDDARPRIAAWTFAYRVQSAAFALFAA